jgi:hypothetical protein
MQNRRACKGEQSRTPNLNQGNLNLHLTAKLLNLTTSFFKICLCLILALGFIALQAQTPFAEFSLERNNIDHIQAFAVGDSVFFTYTDKNPDNATRLKKGYWIDSSGAASRVEINSLEGSLLCGVTKQGGKIFYYYLSKNTGGLHLKMLEQETGSEPKHSNDLVQIQHELVSVHVENNQLFVTAYDPETQSLKFTSLNGSTVEQKSFRMPFDLKKHLRRSGGFIVNSELAGLDQGSGMVKFYREGEQLVITVDERFVYDSSKTTVIKIDPDTGAQSVSVIPSPELYALCSFYHNNLLYRILRRTDKEIKINVYSIGSGEMLYTRTLIKSKALKHAWIVQRLGKERKILHTTMDKLFYFDAELSILVQPVAASEDVRLIIGNFYDQNGPGIVAGVPNPLLMLTTFFASHAVKGLMEGPALSTYAYLKGNVSKGFEFEPVKQNPSASLRQRIDNYEISRDTDVKESIDRWFLYLEYKGYLELKKGAIGIYQEKRKNVRKMILLKY